jgi:hypothetical protein
MSRLRCLGVYVCVCVCVCACFCTCRIWLICCFMSRLYGFVLQFYVCVIHICTYVCMYACMCMGALVRSNASMCTRTHTRINEKMRA